MSLGVVEHTLSVAMDSYLIAMTPRLFGLGPASLLAAGSLFGVALAFLGVVVSSILARETDGRVLTAEEKFALLAFLGASGCAVLAVVASNFDRSDWPGVIAGFVLVFIGGSIASAAYRSLRRNTDGAMTLQYSGAPFVVGVTLVVLGGRLILS